MRRGGSAPRDCAGGAPVVRYKASEANPFGEYPIRRRALSWFAASAFKASPPGAVEDVSMRAMAAVILFVVSSLPALALPSPAGYADAERAFDQLSVNDRLTFKIALTAAGYWPVVADPDFSRKLFDATVQYQADNGLSPSGVVDKELLAKVYRSSSPLLATWGFRPIEQPYRGHPVWVPMGLELIAERDQNGLTWRDPQKRVWVTYDYLRDANLAAAYNSVVAKVVADGGQIAFKSLKDDFFVVSSATHGLDSFIRGQADRRGLLWLSLFWLHDASDLHMDRAAILMSGSFASAMSGAPFAELPAPSPPAAPAVDPATASPGPMPRHQERAQVSGTGFFVNSDGDVLTSAHSVDNCAGIAVARDQSPAGDAGLIAHDAANDLAVLKTTLRPEKAAAIRSGVKLGEAIEAPSSADSHGLTGGAVTSLAGAGGDTRYLQFSGTAQPSDAGAPLFDQYGNVVAVISSNRATQNVVVASAGDVPPDVNFAIKGSLIATFLASNGIAFAEGAASHGISESDLVEQARAVGVSVSCK